MSDAPVDIFEALQKSAISPIWTHVATLVTVGAAVSTSALDHAEDGRRVIALCTVGVVYVVVGTWGLTFTERTGRRSSLAIYFSVMTALLLLLLFLSHGDAWSAALPLLSYVTLFGSGLHALGAGIGFVVLVSFWRVVPSEQPWLGLLTIGSSALFVIAFTLAARRELEWRTRAEALGRELGEANVQLAAYAERVAETSRVEERNRLAREVHDGLGHYLTAIHVQLEAAHTLLERGAPGVAPGLLRAQVLARQGLDDVRHAVTLLREERRPEPSLHERLEELVQAIDLSPVVHLVTTGDARHVDSTVQHALLRVAQEAITNVRRHARATAIQLTLRFDEARIGLVVLDDGAGASGVVPGSGLLGIRERMNQLGGTCHVGARDEGGFAVEVSVPG